MTKPPHDDDTTARKHESTGREAPTPDRTERQGRLPYSTKARLHDSTKREARMHESTKARRHEGTKREARTIHEQVLIVGQLTVLVGVLIAVGLSSAYLGTPL